MTVTTRYKIVIGTLLVVLLLCSSCGSDEQQGGIIANGQWALPYGVIDLIDFAEFQVLFGR